MWYAHLHDLVHNLVNYLHAHPHIGGLVAYFISLAESLAIIGTVIPGSVTMTAIGALIGAGILPGASTMMWAIFGALTGDYISYFAGIYYNERIRNIWPFTKYPYWLKAGETFFHKHGGKSVIIGRFAGPARSLVPLIAGLMHMRLLRFTAAVIPSACLWAIVYMVPGIIIGALSLELPPATATKFIIATLIIITLIWLMFWLLHISFTRTTQQINRFIAKLWNYFKQHRSLHWITTMLNDSRYPEHHQQLALGLFAVFCGFIFILTFISAYTHTLLAHINTPLFDFLRSLRNRSFDNVMIAFTWLGDKKTLLSASGLIFIWLLWRRYWRAAYHWAINLIMSAGIAEVIKHIYFSPRPEGILNQATSSSFPSGHATLSTAILSFLAVLIARELPFSKRRIPYFIAGLFIFSICLSRLYLGAHWFTDVFAGVSLGLTCVFIITISYRRQPTPHIPSHAFTVVSIVLLLLAWLANAIPDFHKSQLNYSLYWPSLTLSTEIWWQHENHQIPLYIVGRLGKPKQVLNVEWLGNLKEIQGALKAQGWKVHPSHINIKSTLTRLSNNQQDKHHLPILPSLYQNRAPVLLLSKPIDNAHQLVLELWRSNIYLPDSDTQLWLGSIYSTHDEKHLKENPSFHKTTQQLIPYLKKFQWRQIQVLPYEQPSAMLPLNWDGNLLLIRPMMKR